MPDGFTSVGGRLIRKQTTSRPGDIWPEVYEAMSKQMRKKAYAAWRVRKEQIRIARERRGISVPYACIVRSRGCCEYVEAPALIVQPPCEQGHREKVNALDVAVDALVA